MQKSMGLKYEPYSEPLHRAMVDNTQQLDQLTSDAQVYAP